ncbi:MAG: hypothetical protein AAGM22_11530 [Acidobacteriota bacterium]
MPGLIGIVRLDGDRPLEVSEGEGLLDEMADRLQHMGNEKLETWADWGRGFAVGRVSPPHLPNQPWPGAQRHGARLFVDGVLHPDLPTPAELWHESPGEEPLPDPELSRRLEGFWCAVSYRPGPGRARDVSIMVDRRASRPLAYTVVDGTLYFAPEVKALLAVPGLERRLDPSALGLFFASGFVLSTASFFVGIERLEGGTLLEVEGLPKVVRYADYRFTVEGDGTPYEDIRRELGAQIRRSVERNYGNPEEDLIFLSGGKDSRLILATALDAVDDPRAVRTISWTSNDPPPGTDVAIARQFAERFGFDYRESRRTLAGYGPKSLRLTWVLDGLTDIGAYHGDELRIMEDLQREGFKKVLRGDQCFTRGRAMLDSAYAILRMCIRSTAGLADGAFAWRQGPYQEVCEAGDAVIEALVQEYRDVQKDNTGDEVYFRHRLQGYLNAAAYFKTLVLDHRNPLLDEGLLRLIQRLSVAARDEQRVLDEAGAESFAPYYTAFPFASSSNLERFADQLAGPTPVRAAVRRELEDRDSAAWEWMDREALLARLDSMALGAGAASRPGVGTRLARAAKKVVRGTVKDVVSKAVYDIPSVDTRIRSVYLKRITRDDEVLFRAVTLKQMIDLFHTGGGSRRVFEERHAAAREAETSSGGPGRA